MSGFLEEVALEMKYMDVEIPIIKYWFATSQISSLIFDHF